MNTVIAITVGCLYLAGIIIAAGDALTAPPRHGTPRNH